MSKLRIPAMCIACGLLSLSPCTVSAKPPLDILPQEGYFLSELPVVLSVTRLAQPRNEAPAAVTVIDRAMIEASGALEIPDLLRLVPGFQVAHASGHYISATYQGLSDAQSRRMQVLVDGRSIYTSALGGVDWTDLPLAIEDIERIEVIRGPNAAAYGSNAFLGAINIVTRHAAEDRGTFTKAATGSNGIRKALLRHGGIGGDLDYRFTVGYRQDDGFDDRNDHKRVRLLTFRGDYVISPVDSLEIQAGYNGGRRGQGEEDPVRQIMHPEHDRRVRSHFQQLRWVHSKGADQEFSLQLYHNYRRQMEAFDSMLLSEALTRLSQAQGGPPVSPGAVPLLMGGQPDQLLSFDYSAQVQRYDIEFQHTQRHGENTRTLWGAGARRDEVSGATFFNRETPVSTRLLRLFGNLEWHALPDLIVNAGAMLEDHDFTGTDISPRAAVNYLITPQHTLRAGVSRALRTPSAFEERADFRTRFADGSMIEQQFFSPGGLRPERILSRELGYLGTFPEVDLTLDVRLFHNRIRDPILLVRDHAFPEPFIQDGAFVYTNSGRLDVRGLETHVEFRPAERTLIGVAFAFTRPKGEALGEINPASHQDLAQTVPRRTLSVFAMHELPHHVQVSALYYRVGKMRWMGDGESLDTQRRLDLRVAKGFRINGVRGTAALTGQNVLSDYREFRSVNVFDRRLYAEISFMLP